LGGSFLTPSLPTVLAQGHGIPILLNGVVEVSGGIRICKQAYLVTHLDSESIKSLLVGNEEYEENSRTGG
jgi:hypothetical protein